MRRTEIRNLNVGDHFKWSEWVLQICTPPLGGWVTCKVVDGAWAPSVWSRFAECTPVQPYQFPEPEWIYVIPKPGGGLIPVPSITAARWRYRVGDPTTMENVKNER
jgi:hypothetical protein